MREKREGGWFEKKLKTGKNDQVVLEKCESASEDDIITI
jgi:hypothetical protein